MTQLLDHSAGLDFGVDGAVIKRAQYIPPTWLASLQEERAASSAPSGDFHRAASIPVAVHETWLREGYDCTREPIRKTLARLSALGMEAFITTNKAL